jgi:hypothetical protein
VVKTDEQGEMLWDRVFGGEGWDSGASVQQVDDGGFVVGGSMAVWKPDSAATPNFDLYLVRTDAEGELQWEKTFGGSGDDIGYEVRQTADGGFLFVGNTGSFGPRGTSAYFSNAYVVKANHEGEPIWSKVFGGPDYDGASSIIETEDGGFLFTGVTHSAARVDADIYVVKSYDPE